MIDTQPAPTDDAIYAVVSIWAATVGGATAAERRAVEEHELTARLARISESVLRSTASDRLRAGARTAFDRLPLAGWLANATHASHAAAGDGTSPAHLKARALVADRRARWIHRDLPGLSAPAILAALAELERRAAGARLECDVLTKRPLRWEKQPTANLVGAPVISADEVEVAITALLSATDGTWTFSSTPTGRMFTHSRHGYSSESDRTYLEGLSDIVDATSFLVERHRGGVGGRVHTTARYVKCAECDRVMAWIGHEGVGRGTAFGRCSAISSSRRR